MRSASGKTASRVCMGLLADSCDFLSGGSERLVDPRRRRSSRHIMDGKHVVELHKIVKVALEMRIDAGQFLQGKLLKFTLLIQREAHRFSHLLMSNSKWNTLTDQVCGGCKRVHVSGCGRLLHSRKIKLHGLHPSRHQWKQ